MLTQSFRHASSSVTAAVTVNGAARLALRSSSFTAASSSSSPSSSVRVAAISSIQRLQIFSSLNTVRSPSPDANGSLQHSIHFIRSAANSSSNTPVFGSHHFRRLYHPNTSDRHSINIPNCESTPVSIKKRKRWTNRDYENVAVNVCAFSLIAFLLGLEIDAWEERRKALEPEDSSLSDQLKAVKEARKEEAKADKIK